MILSAVVLLPLAMVKASNGKSTFDSCVVGNESLLSLSMTAFCPLLPRSGPQHESSCSVILDAEGIKNQDCSHCHWRERDESPCYTSVDKKRQHCCCRAPNCNQRLIEDAILGWKKVKVVDDSCLSANLSTIMGDLKWKHNPPEKCLDPPDAVTMCSIKVEYASGVVAAITTGCLSSAMWNEIKVKYNFSCNGKDYEWNSASGMGVACCGGSRCTSKLYREVIFRELQRTRVVSEYKYAKLLEQETTKETEHIWATDQAYLSAQTLFEVVMFLFTSIYLSGLYYIYVTYKPTDMEKRPYVPRAKR
ncbi:hypothetical protein GCK32_006645 [Trichostrongylus colubriformis]|uniref:Uncharacterized protein n=1 Tax=Trichostrongylus colubriformis TaxID=6319 RepID=A0AAN8FH78_TRICO